MKTWRNSFSDDRISIRLTRFFQKINVYKEKAHPITGQNSLVFIGFINIIKVLEEISQTSIINYAGDLIIIIMRPKASLTYCYIL